jgi:hypothetical protein
MPRAFRRRPPAMLAASPALVAAALGLRQQEISDAIKRGELKVYQVGARRRLFVLDALRWARRTFKEVQP